MLWNKDDLHSCADDNNLRFACCLLLLFHHHLSFSRQPVESIEAQFVNPSTISCRESDGRHHAETLYRALKLSHGTPQSKKSLGLLFYFPLFPPPPWRGSGTNPTCCVCAAGDPLGDGAGSGCLVKPTEGCRAGTSLSETGNDPRRTKKFFLEFFWFVCLFLPVTEHHSPTSVLRGCSVTIVQQGHGAPSISNWLLWHDREVSFIKRKCVMLKSCFMHSVCHKCRSPISGPKS